MSDGWKSHVRTYWPIVLGQLTTMLLAWLATDFGIVVDDKLAYALVSAAVTALVYSAGRWLETRHWAPARKVGQLIVGLGLKGTPTYPEPLAPGTVRPLRQPDHRHRL